MGSSLKSKLDKLILSAAYISLATLGLLLLAELGARLVLVKLLPAQEARENTEAYSHFDWRQRFFEDLKKPGARFIYEPFSGWKRTDKTTASFNVRDGYRLTWEPKELANKDDFVIFLFGGSTAYCEESPDDLTIASILAKKLNQPSRGYRYLVRNYGVSGFVNDNELALLATLLRSGERPNAVIFYDGLNDIQIKVALGRVHFYDEYFRRNLFQRRSLKQLGAEIAYRLQLVRYLTRSHVVQQSYPVIRDRAILRRNAERMLRDYAETVRQAGALGKEYGFRTIHFWQPSPFATNKTLTAEELSQIRSTGHRDLVDAIQIAHDIVAELAAEEDFLDDTGVIDIRDALDNVSESIFVGANHMTPIGNDAVAEAMLPWVLELQMGGERTVSQLPETPLPR